MTDQHGLVVSALDYNLEEPNPEPYSAMKLDVWPWPNHFLSRQHTHKTSFFKFTELTRIEMVPDTSMHYTDATLLAVTPSDSHRKQTS